MNTLLKELSHATTTIVEDARESVVCVGTGKATPRTGFVVAPGEVVTVAMAAEPGESVPVHGPDGEINATVVGFDASSGLALLGADGLTRAVRPRETPVSVGELGVTIGCPVAGGHEASLSMIRCVGPATRLRGGRRVAGYLQTDTPRFRGSGGSVLFDADGRAVALTMPTGRREEPFLLPVGEVLAIVANLREGTSVGTAYLGITSTPVKLPVEADARSHGLLVTGVEEESPAAQGGLSVGAFLISVAGVATASLEELYDALVGRTAGERLPLEVAAPDGTVTTVEVEVVLRS